MRNLHRISLGRTAQSIALLLCAALVLTACATTQRTRSAKAAGFLEEPWELRKGEGKEAQFIYINPKTDFSAYDKILIEPITVWAVKSETLTKVSKKDLQELVNHLHVALTTQLERDYTLVDRAGPGVMRVRAAITEAKGSKVVADVISTAIPQLRTIATVTKLAADTHVLVGKASIEGEILDSLTGERLLAAIDERAGTKALRGSLGTWNDVKGAHDHWAERLRIRLTELRAR